MTLSSAGLIITIAGLIFFAISLAVIFFGKKVGENNKAQTIKLWKVDINANSVVVLLLITAGMALTPIFLQYWKPDLDNYISRQNIESNYLPLDGLSMNIRGSVIDETGFASKVQVKVNRILGQKTDTIMGKTGQMGDFHLDLVNVRPNEKYELFFTKEGYTDKQINFGFLEFNANHILSKAESEEEEEDDDDE